MAKKFYKKIDILFWFFMMFLPIFIGLISVIGYCCNFKLTGSVPSTSSFSADLLDVFGRSCSGWLYFIPNFIVSTFVNLFTTIGITDITFNTMLSIIVGWFVWVIYLHLLVDVLAFIPKFFHKWLRRVDKYDE